MYLTNHHPFLSVTLERKRKRKERASPEMFFTEKYVRGIPQQKLRYQHAFILFLQDFKGNISKSCFKGLVGLQVNLTDIRKATDLKRKFQLESNTNQISEVYSPDCSLYIPRGADEENLFHNPQLL